MTTPPAPKHQPQRAGWDLRWRTSPKVAPAPTAAQPPQVNSDTHRVQAVQYQSNDASTQTHNGLRVAAEAPTLGSVATAGVNQVVWQDSEVVAPAQTPRELRLHHAQAVSAPINQETDFFASPFGEEAAKTPVTTQQQDQEMVLPQLDGQPTAPSDLGQPAPELVPPAPEEIDTGNSLRGQIQFTPSQTGTPPENQVSPQDAGLFAPPTADEAPDTAAPDTAAPDATQQVPSQDAGPSIGDMMRETSPNVGPSTQEDQAAPRLDSLENLPPPATAPARPRNQPMDDLSSPFEAASPSDADRRDLNRLNSGRLRENEYRDSSPVFGGGTDFLDPTQFSCDEFRQRIAAQTIDKVSLDVSPPFRPDEFDVERYKEMKADFDDKQVIREWVSRNGQQLANGRLRDLAYEKAIIETDNGQLKKLPINQLSEGDIAYITENWGLPRECLIEQVAYAPRAWVPTTMTWKASNLCHSPLYFEDVNLERYGHTHGPLLEPFVQSAHFFGNIAVLPYKMGVHTPCECQYALGYYRPGNCAPWIKQPVPISARGAIAQAATMTGLFWLIP